jgi:hypothetical protein
MFGSMSRLTRPELILTPVQIDQGLGHSVGLGDITSRHKAQIGWDRAPTRQNAGDNRGKANLQDDGKLTAIDALFASVHADPDTIVKGDGKSGSISVAPFGGVIGSSSKSFQSA